MLLDDIIELATNDQRSVSILLRKCLVLGHKLNNEHLIGWASKELNGYEWDEELPSYRVAAGAAKGHLAGSFGAEVSNYPIPAFLLDENHRERATTLYLREAISTYEDLMNRRTATLMLEWPADLVMYYQNRVVTANGCHLVQAWQTLDRSALAQIVDAIRNRVLSMALDIRRSIGKNDEELENASPQAAANIERSIVNNIYGGNNYFASGHSRVTSENAHNETNIAVGDTGQLASALKAAGISESSLSTLSKAMKEDGDKKFGHSVQEWIKENAPKAIIGGVKIGANAAIPLLTSLLKQHFGIAT
jgi:AbiTii